jgi:hypothetical protein
MARIILHDTRLNGKVEAGLGRVIQVDGNTPLSQALSSVAAAATSSPVELVIACHGYMSHEYDRASHAELSGGQGLQLCRESLLLGNVSSVGAWKDLFTRIWLMACGPAGTLVHNSRPFCREFAHYANTIVIASERAQTYHPGTYDSAQLVSRPVLRFGAWEGRVFLFFPDGTVSDFVQSESPLP